MTIVKSRSLQYKVYDTFLLSSLLLCLVLPYAVLYCIHALFLLCTASCFVVLCFMVWCSVVWYGMVWYGMVWCCVMWYGQWCSVVLYSMVCYGACCCPRSHVITRHVITRVITCDFGTCPCGTFVRVCMLWCHVVSYLGLFPHDFFLRLSFWRM